MNTVWNDAELTAIYTLTPLHVGSGQAAAAVDLPVARDASNGFPIIPATGLKGAAREALAPPALSEGQLTGLFGPDLNAAEGSDDPSTGALTFTEARLVAYPVRSLNRPFLHVTCALIVERLYRDLRSAGLSQALPHEQWQPELTADKALVAAGELAGEALVLEDLVFSADEVIHSPPLAAFGQAMAALLPRAEEPTRRRLHKGLVMVPDADFAELMARTVPVRARIKLTDGKTTDEWRSEDGAKQSGNLWYEELLPADCLFLTLIGERRQRSRGGEAKQRQSEPNLDTLRGKAGTLAAIQLGGNETVGYGLCWWSGWQPPKETAQGGGA